MIMMSSCGDFWRMLVKQFCLTCHPHTACPCIQSMPIFFTTEILGSHMEPGLGSSSGQANIKQKTKNRRPSISSMTFYPLLVRILLHHLPCSRFGNVSPNLLYSWDYLIAWFNYWIITEEKYPSSGLPLGTVDLVVMVWDWGHMGPPSYPTHHTVVAVRRLFAVLSVITPFQLLPGGLFWDIWRQGWAR